MSSRSGKYIYAQRFGSPTRIPVVGYFRVTHCRTSERPHSRGFGTLPMGAGRGRNCSARPDRPLRSGRRGALPVFAPAVSEQRRRTRPPGCVAAGECQARVAIVPRSVLDSPKTGGPKNSVQYTGKIPENLLLFIVMGSPSSPRRTPPPNFGSAVEGSAT